MKILKRILLTLGGILMLLLLISFFLPSNVKVERSITINTKAQTPFDYVNNLKMWEKWSPWHALDTLAIWEFSEPASGSNAWYTWKSNNPDVGNGKLTIVESKPYELIHTKLEFEGMGISYADYIFTPEGEGVKVTWTLESNGEGMPWYMVPMSRYFNLFMDKMIGSDYEKGLNNLKKISEENTGFTIAGLNAELKDLSPINFIGIKSYTKFEDIGMILSKHYGMLAQHLNDNKSQPVGSPFTINYKVDEKGIEMMAAIPVQEGMSANAPIEIGNIPACKALVINYYGNYENTGNVYEPAYAWIKEQNLSEAMPPMEFYVTDPMMEKDTAKWLTQIIIPVK